MKASDVDLISMEAIQAYAAGIPPETAQFDFLLGEWKTTMTRHAPDGSAMVTAPGTWKAKHLHDGRILFDEYLAFAPGTEMNIAYMSTLRTFSPLSKQWEMTFLLAHQEPILNSFRGQFVDGETDFRASGTLSNGQAVIAKVRFFDIAENSFEWTDHISLDDGKSWSHRSTISAIRTT